MTTIFDNIEEEFGPHLGESFEAADRIDAAVGYFNLRGWGTFCELVEKKEPPADGKPVARVLIGMTNADPDSRVQRHLQAQIEDVEAEVDIDRTTARRRRDRAINKFRMQLMRGVPNEQDLGVLRTLRDQLANGKVELKLFTRRPLHGKTYICHQPGQINLPRVGFVGSSNLTLAGLKHNYELNVDVVDGDAARKLDKWFEDRWQDRFAIDITEKMVELIDESWASEQPLDPYLAYLKVCYLLSQDAREGLVEYSVPATIRDELLEFQASAVKTLGRRIIHRGGAMLGDVVGLGKTITAIAVAAMLREEHGYTTLVICPPNLVEMWEEYLETYEIIGKVVPYSMAVKELPGLRRYRFVIVDESHTMRSDTRQDYQAIRGYLEENDSKVLLLTATPYNKRYLDVANQLALYIEEDQNLGIAPVHAMEKRDNLEDLVDGKTYTLAAFRYSEEAEDWRRLMSEHLVRRTRSFVRDNYAEIDDQGREYLEFSDGTPFYFPERDPRPLEHAFSEDDPAQKMVADSTLNAIDGLLLPRYQLGDYLVPGAARKANAPSADVVADLEKASGNLIGFIRTSLYKRLSSCGHSFLVSLRRHLARNELYIHALDNGVDLPIGSVLETMLDVDTDAPDEDIDEAGGPAAERYAALRARTPKPIRWISADLFNDQLRDDLQADSDTIRGLLTEFGEWHHDADSKVAALAKLLTEDHPDDKVLIFSEYKDTVNYVTDALRDLGVTDIAGVSGDTDNPTRVARRFAPRSNSKLVDVDLDEVDELRVLVSTDVLSEGQNLQDAHIVVNYDLPWAIIKLIQRAGRVDRIGQEAEEVLVYSMLPDDGVEAILSLRQRIARRLGEAAKAFGSDEQFFGTEEEVAAIEGLYTGDIAGLEGLDVDDGEVDASSYAHQVWQRAEAEHQHLAERARALPDLVHATKAALGDEQATGVVAYVRTERGVDGFGYAPADGSDPQLLTGMEALQMLACEPGTPGLPRTDSHFAQVIGLVRGPLRRPKIVAGKLRGVRKRVWSRLNGALASDDPDVQEALDALFGTPLTTEAETRLKQALRDRNNDDLADLLVLLHRDGRLIIPDTPDADPLRIVCSVETVTP